MTWNQQPVWIRRWGGVCQGAVPEHIPLGLFSDALNYEITQAGGLAPRMGFHFASALPAPDEKPIRTIFPADMDGTVRILVATSLNVYEYTPDLNKWSPSLYSIVGGESAARMTFALLNGNACPMVVWGNGADPMQVWDGSTVIPCAGTAPMGRPISYKNYLVVFNIVGSPGKVQFGIIPGDPNTWTSGGQEKFVEMQGKVTGVFPFSGLVVFTETRTELFSGDPDQAQGMAVLSATIGCQVHESAADCGGVLVWLSQGGIMAWDGGSFPSVNLSSPDDSASVDAVRSCVQRDVDLIEWKHPELISGVYDPLRRRYMLAAKARKTPAGVLISRTLTYDFRFKAWLPWDLDASFLAVTVSPVTRRQVVLAGLSCGHISKQISSAPSDEIHGEAPHSYREYDFWAKSGDHDLGDPDMEKVFRAITICSTGSAGVGITGARTFKAKFRGEFDRTDGGEADIATAPTGFVLGVNVLGDALSASDAYLEKRGPLALRAIHINWTFFGKGRAQAMVLSAFALHFIPWSKPRQILVGPESSAPI